MAELGRFLSQTSTNVQNNTVEISDLSGIVDGINLALETTDENVTNLFDIFTPIDDKFSDEYNNFSITNISGINISCQNIYSNEIYLNGIKLSPSGSNVDISNNTANALITVDGSNNTLFANPQLTFDSSDNKLYVNGSIMLTGDINTNGGNINANTIITTEIMSTDTITATGTISGNTVIANTLSGTSLYLNGNEITPNNFGLNICGTPISNALLQLSGTDTQHLYSTIGLLYSNNILTVPTISGNTISGNTVIANNISGQTISGEYIYGTAISGTSLYINGVNITGNGNVNIINNIKNAILTVSGDNDTNLYGNTNFTYDPIDGLTIGDSGNINLSGNLVALGNLSGTNLTVSGVSTDNNGNINLSGNLIARGNLSGSSLYLTGASDNTLTISGKTAINTYPSFSGHLFSIDATSMTGSYGVNTYDVSSTGLYINNSYGTSAGIILDSERSLGGMLIKCNNSIAGLIIDGDSVNKAGLIVNTPNVSGDGIYLNASGAKNHGLSIDAPNVLGSGIYLNASGAKNSGLSIDAPNVLGSGIYLNAQNNVNGIYIDASGAGTGININATNISWTGINLNVSGANTGLTIDGTNIRNNIINISGNNNSTLIIDRNCNLTTTGNLSGTNLTVSGVSTDNNGNINLSGNLIARGNIYTSGNVTVSGNLNSNSLSVINNIGCRTITGANGFSLDTCGNLHTNLTYSTSSRSNDQSGNIFTNGSIVVGKNICMTPSGNLYGGNFVLPTYLSGNLPSGTPSGTIVLYRNNDDYCLAVNPSGISWLYTPSLLSDPFQTFPSNIFETTNVVTQQ